MRIISKFKDYYDSAASTGIDMTQVYLRETKVIDNLGADNVYSEILKSAPCASQFRHYSFRNSNNKWSVKTEILGFCGKIYPLFIFESMDKDDKSGLTTKIDYAYSMSDILEILNRIDPEFTNSHQWSTNDKWANYSEKRFIDTINAIQKIVNDDLFHESKSPYWRLISRNQEHINFKGRAIVCNPILKDIGFQRQLDSYSAFQEISQYYFGVMATHGKDIPYIEDKYMVASKGFDTTYGFRKRP
jgi:hypothetical protein